MIPGDGEQSTGSAALERWGTPGISASPPELQQLEDWEGEGTLEEGPGLLNTASPF